MSGVLYIIKIDGRDTYCCVVEEPAKSFARDLKTNGKNVQLVRRTLSNVHNWMNRHKHVDNVPRKYFP